MRVLVVLLLVPLAGCIDGDDAPAALDVLADGLTGFHARYETRNGSFLELRLDRTATVVDADLRPYTAYAVDLRSDWYPLVRTFGNLPTRDEVDATLYLDAGLRLVRMDGCLGFEVCPDDHVQVSWRGRGSYPPLGLFLPALAEDGVVTYLVADEVHEARLETRDGWTRLVDGLSPGEILTYADARFQYDDGPLPTAMDLPAVWGPPDGRTLLHRVSLETLDPLPPADEWPLFDAAPAQPARAVLFEGEGLEGFRTGIRFIDGFEEILRQVPEARAAHEEGCVSVYLFYWGGGSRWNVEPVDDLLRHDVAKVQAGFFDAGGRYRAWEVRYEQGTPLTPYEPGQTEMRPPGNGPYECPDILGGSGAADDFLLDAWNLPTPRSGVPCMLGAFRGVTWHNASAVPRAPTFFAFLTLADETGDPWPDPGKFSIGGGPLYQDSRTGDWMLLRLHEEELALLESDEWQGRPVPQEPVRLGPKYTCAPPGQAEPPIR